MLNMQWYEYPSLVLQNRELSGLRTELREKNLFEADPIRPKDDPGEPSAQAVRARTPDGMFNDLNDPWMGAAGTGFGRNAPLHRTITHTKKLLDPDPRLISRKLMARDTFNPAGIVNTIAAAWIHPLLRLAYIGMYVGNVPALRGLCWAGGLTCSGLLYVEGLKALLVLGS